MAVRNLDQLPHDHRAILSSCIDCLASLEEGLGRPEPTAPYRVFESITWVQIQLSALMPPPPPDRITPEPGAQESWRREGWRTREGWLRAQNAAIRDGRAEPWYDIFREIVEADRPGSGITIVRSDES
jgi:hypothetical protein